MEEDDLLTYESGEEGFEDVDNTYAVNRNKMPTIKSKSLPSFTREDLGSALLTVLHQPDANFLPFDKLNLQDSSLIDGDLEWISNSSAFPVETFPNFLPKPVPPKQNSPESFLSSSSSASSSKRPTEALGIVKKARTKRNARKRVQSSWQKSPISLTKPTQTRGPRVLGRKCQHCGSEKTPQWRAGPHGAKTLCNACGVRFKSGRLVPEYRPANSPTFRTELHSNSHRKVVEMRRVKQMMGLTVAGPVHQSLD